MLGNNVAVATGIIRLDTSDIEAKMPRATSQLDNLTNVSRNSYFGLRNIGVAFEAVGDAAVAGIGLASKAAMDWESALAQVDRTNSQVTNGVIQNQDALNQLHTQLQAIVALTPTSPTVVGAIATEAGQLGVHTSDVGNFTKAVVDLSTVTKTAPDAVAQGLGRIATLTGTTGAQYENLASSIADVQRKSGASMSSIIDNTTRLAGIGTSFKMTAGEIAGVGGELAALGIQGRIGITTIQQVFNSMDDSIRNNGAHLQNFAQIAGVSVDQFKKDFQQDATTALLEFNQGLANTQAAGKDITPVLESVGLTQNGVTRTLRQLAVAQTDAAGTQQTLTDMVRIGNEGFAASNDLLKQAQAIYNTTSSQLSILHNDVTLAAMSFGSLFLPVIRAVASVLQDVSLGLAGLPTWARAAIAVFAGLAAVVGVVGGAFLLLLPRFLIARDTLIRLAQGMTETGAATGETEAVTGVYSATLEVLIGLTQELVATQLVLLGEYEDMPAALAAMEAGMAGYTAETVATTVATDVETASVGLLSAAWTALQAVMGPAGWAMLAVAAIAVTVIAVLGALGKAHKDAAKETLDHAQADQQLVSILEGEPAKIQDATAAWVLNKLAMDGSLTSLEKLGVSTKDVVSLVTGNLPANKIKSISDALEKAAKGGDEGAKKALANLPAMIGTYSASVNAENALTTARKQGALAANDDATAADNVGKANLTAAQKVDQAAQAARNYASDLLSEKQAALQVKDAQETLAKAADDLKNKDQLLADAQDKVAVSQTAELVANDKLIDAQRQLARARTDAQKTLDEAVRQQAADDLALKSAQLQVQDSQNKLNKLMDPAESADKLRDATNELRDAQLGLIDTQQGVADAQWYVNYLMGEGASARDIQDARRALDAANQKAADQTDKVSDSQAKLNEITNGGQAALDEAQAEIQLEQAEIQVQEAQARLADQQQKVIDLRQDVANDVAYHQALENEQSAQEGVEQAHINTRTALQNLHNIQDGSLERAFTAAQLGVEGAIISQASAITNTQKDWDAMHGTFWTATQDAQHFAKNLTDLGNTITGKPKTDIDTMATAVGNFATNFDDLKGKTDGANASLAAVGPNAAAAIDALKKAKDDTVPTFWHKVGDEIDRVAQLFTGRKGDDWIQKFIGVSTFLNPATSGAAVGKTIYDWATGHAEGGYFTKPHLAMVAEDGPELILPLTDPARMDALLRQAGIAGQRAITPVPTSGAGNVVQHVDQSKTVNQGDFNAQINGYTDLDAAMRDWSWENRLVSRSA